MRIPLLIYLLIGIFPLSAQEVPVDSCRSLDAKDFSIRMQTYENLLLIDTRTFEEFAEARMPGAILVESTSKLAEMADSLDLDRPIFLYCENNQRSPVACQVLCEMGFRNVYNLKGGLNEWRFFNYKLDKEKIRKKRKVH